MPVIMHYKLLSTKAVNSAFVKHKTWSVTWQKERRVFVYVRACVCKQDAEKNTWYQGEEVREE